jgi:hypothetical protein
VTRDGAEAESWTLFEIATVNGRVGHDRMSFTVRNGVLSSGFHDLPMPAVTFVCCMEKDGYLAKIAIEVSHPDEASHALVVPAASERHIAYMSRV